MEERSVADIEGPWMDPDFESSLIDRCRRNWTTPVRALSNSALATIVRQAVALQLVVPEARHELARIFTVRLASPVHTARHAR